MDSDDASVFLVEERANPTTAYYLDPLLSAAGASVTRFGFDQLPSDSPSAPATVVFVRYVPDSWKIWIARNRDRLGGVVLFLDDDVLDWHAARGMPWRYRWKLWRLAGRHAGWLRQQGVRLWVSTPYLRERYADWSPTLVPPASLAPSPRAPVRVFYHGTASHRAEIRWLQRVMPGVLEADPDVHFELVADMATAKAWRGCPRVTLVHPMPWPAYHAFSELAGRDIGLAPLLDSRFNRSRSHTKFFDITRSGAVGVYSDGPVYRQAVRDGVEGRLVPNREAQWIETILELARDGALRDRLLSGARRRVDELDIRARRGYRGSELWE